ncbi:hypothetical protein GCM10007981_12840 [Thermocladium modestius]|uniref:Uncharacterized protein n=1 Tax=Thermocladium modestius TaxID=62609 RepID=A0A830GVY0_9CREN|nr:hypothetical protein [Thermocladium modestius]GGP21355.1 hypothetical protein GCM10007981_12840 [Thermocladium modestius]
MGIINVNKKAGAMLDELMKDLSRNDLALLERLPHVRETERYRDVIINTLREFHISLVLVRLVFDDGKIKGYSFLIRGDGEVGSLPSSGVVEGFIVEHGGGRSTKFLYEPEEFNGGADLEGRVKMFADMYRKAEERLTELRFKKVYREREAFYLPE